MKKLIAITVLAGLMLPSICTATLSAGYTPATFACNGSTTNFSVTWSFWSSSDLVVKVTDGDGTETTLTEGAGAGKYTIYAANSDYSSGARISTGTTYDSDYTITIFRSVPYTQELDIGGDFVPAEPLEQQLDKLAAQIQQLSVGDISNNYVNTTFYLKYGTNEVMKIQATGPYAFTIYCNSSTGWVEQMSFAE